ncbi:serine hydrolase domain-containing protein [Actinoallomurus sp. CA-150999]|uniref:serine hydrolase domain-containing protein n=1 Tax=Actinoallomurus sp. CA-150999 TaxID=3239887 RepID=UPI003D8C1BE9
MNRATTARVAGLACAMLTLSIAAPATAATAERAGRSRPQVGNVRKAMEALAKSAGVVGAIGEVYVDGKRVGKGSAGSRLLGGKRGRIPAGSRYRIGSQTKQITATVLLQLVQEGRLSLDDKLSKVLPEVAAQGLVERADDITVRELIRHTSGIPDFFDSGRFDDFDFTTYYRPVDLVKASRSLPRTGEPGEKFSYSNTNYVLIGMIIERLTGRTLSDEFTRRIFAPLRMKSTYLTFKPPQGIKGPHGHGYFPDAEGRPRDADRQNASFGGAAGGIVSTAHDISVFRRAFSQGRLLPPALQQEIVPPAPKPQASGATPPPRVCGGEPALELQAGSGPGFAAVTFATPDGRLQFAVSATLSVSNMTFDPAALNKAAEAVLCPTK